jgi:hypothetical protein
MSYLYSKLPETVVSPLIGTGGLEDTEWSLEIVANDGNSTVWNDLFPSDEDALAEALNSIGEDGIRSFSEGAPDAAVH